VCVSAFVYVGVGVGVNVGVGVGVNVGVGVDVGAGVGVGLCMYAFVCINAAGHWRAHERPSLCTLTSSSLLLLHD